jgi:hypothetical protein
MQPTRTPMDRTVITFDPPDEREIILDRLLPMLRPDDVVEIEIEDNSHVVQSSMLSISASGDLSLHLRLRAREPAGRALEA